MKLEVWAIGKTSEAYLSSGIQAYQLKISHFIPFGYHELPESRLQKSAEKGKALKNQADLLISRLAPEDHVVLLDEKGKQMNSVQFASYLNGFLISSYKRVVFLTGGAYGFHDTVYKKYPEKLSLSNLTFPHDMVRLFLLEQIYRGCSILKNQPYHHI